MSSPQPGQKYGPYQVISQIGQGGMATVYKAYHAAMDRYVALKVLPHQFAQTEEFMGRFRQEVRLIARLEHPHILPVYDYGESEGIPYLVMRLLGKGTLRERIRAGVLELDEIDRIFKQLAEGLAYAHEQGVIHRDIKPSNVMLDPRGDVFLTDFGIAKLVEATAQFTATGAVTGTPAYMSPEQAQGEKVDPRTDIYSLGIVLYEMLTGKVPFEAETPLAVLLKKVQEPPPPPTVINPEVPEPLEAVLLKALATDPGDRYATVREFLVAWTGALAKSRQETMVRAAVKEKRELDVAGVEQEVARRAARKAPPPAKRSDRGKRPPWVWFMGGATVVLILTLAIISFVYFGNALFSRTPTAQVPVVALVTKSPVTLKVTATSTDAPALPTVTQPLPTDTLAPTPVPSNTPFPGQIVDNFGVPMVLIPAGLFEMGSAADDALAECQRFRSDYSRSWLVDEEPVHSVLLGNYYIDQYEVTNARYAACVRVGRCDPPSETGSDTRGSYYGNDQYAEYPVIYISWEDASAYCEWRGARLPSEAEWEKAARGPQGWVYPWGGQFDGSQANFCDLNCTMEWSNLDYDDGYADTAPVGSYNPNSYGLYDMAGNVWEWVYDLYLENYYATLPTDVENPTGPPTGLQRILRGGAWDNIGCDLRSANRGGFDPTSRFNRVGFRCVRSP